MACPVGSVNCGGQPKQSGCVRNWTDLKAMSAKCHYDYDKKNAVPKSHESKVVENIYKDFLGEPNSHTAHKYLHTTYTKRNKY